MLDALGECYSMELPSFCELATRVVSVVDRLLSLAERAIRFAEGGE